MKTQNYIIRGIPDDLHREWKVRAAEEGKTMRDIIVEALIEYLKLKGVTLWKNS